MFFFLHAFVCLHLHTLVMIFFFLKSFEVLIRVWLYYHIFQPGNKREKIAFQYMIKGFTLFPFWLLLMMTADLGSCWLFILFIFFCFCNRCDGLRLLELFLMDILIISKNVSHELTQERIGLHVIRELYKWFDYYFWSWKLVLIWAWMIH